MPTVLQCKIKLQLGNRIDAEKGPSGQDGHSTDPYPKPLILNRGLGGTGFGDSVKVFITGLRYRERKQSSFQCLYYL